MIVVPEFPLCNRPAHPDNPDHLPKYYFNRPSSLQQAGPSRWYVSFKNRPAHPDDLEYLLKYYCNRLSSLDDSDHLPTGRPIRKIRMIYQNIIWTDRPLCNSFERYKIKIISIFMSFINSDKILCKVCSSWYEHSLMLSVEAQWLLSSSAVRKEDTKPSAKTQDIVLLFVRIEDTIAKDTRHCLVICSNYQRHKTLSCNLFELEKEKVASAS